MSDHPSVGQLSVKWDVLLIYSIGVMLIIIVLLLMLA